MHQQEVLIMQGTSMTSIRDSKQGKFSAVIDAEFREWQVQECSVPRFAIHTSV